MERLTIPDVRVDEHTTRRSIIDALAVQEHAMEIYHQLKIYEDIAELCGGFDRLHELAEADKDGRVVVLPCKVGDELWTWGDFSHGREVYRFTVSDVSTMNGRTVLNTLGLGTIRPEDIGKTVFLTREEAERAMEGRKESDHA